jgi:hypothetical protein
MVCPIFCVRPQFPEKNEAAKDDAIFHYFGWLTVG